MEIRPDQQHVIEGENLIHSGLSIMKTVRYNLERGNVSVSQVTINMLTRWIDNAQDWRGVEMRKYHGKTS